MAVIELKAAANVRGHLTQCFICDQWFTSIHWHHTIPRAVGGHSELQIPLCGSCHTALHAKASAIIALVQGSRKQKIARYWANPAHERAADRWCEILVKALLTPVTDGKQTLISASVSKRQRQVLEIIKKQYRLSSISMAVLMCIDCTAAKEGLYNNEQVKPPKLW